jgi:DNA-binding NarL/FixJ family response regulator
MPPKIRVAILDDHQSIIDGYRFRLSQSPEIEVVATTAYAVELENVLTERPVDVLILDVNVPTGQDNANPYPILYAIPRWLQQYPQLSILVISMHDQRTLIKNVMEAGASGYILKDDPDTIRELASVVRAVAGGGIHFSQRAHRYLLKDQSEAAELTGRQVEVISLCAAYPNKTSSDLAQEMGIANSTVRNLLSSAYLRLGARNRVAAITKARQLGLIAPPISYAESQEEELE